MLQPYIVQTVAVGLALVGLLYAITSRLLFVWSRRRIERVEKNEPFDSLTTDTPHPDQDRVDLKRAKASIRDHFRNTKRLLLPGFIFLTLVAASMPFLSAVPAAYVSVVLGVFTVTAGLAVKPLVENFISGLVMGFSKVLNIGDTVVVNDIYATVEDISLTHTTLKIWDWRRHVIPNSKMIQLDFLNYTVVDSFQWAYIEFWISYDADLEAVKELVSEAARTSSYFADYEEPSFFVMDTAKESVCCWLAAWANNPTDAWMLKADIRAGLITGMQKIGVSPHQYHLVTEPKNRPMPSETAA